jgi:hypothetical protein
MDIVPSAYILDARALQHLGFTPGAPGTPGAVVFFSEGAASAIWSSQGALVACGAPAAFIASLRKTLATDVAYAEPFPVEVTPAGWGAPPPDSASPAPEPVTLPSLSSPTPTHNAVTLARMPEQSESPAQWVEALGIAASLHAWTFDHGLGGPHGQAWATLAHAMGWELPPAEVGPDTKDVSQP